MHLLIALLLATPGLMEGKVKTDRTVVCETVVDAPPAEVFALWTTPEGTAKFFAPQARIDARPGGEYTMIFDPGVDPDGSSYGTKGARILKLEPPSLLSFEWITFTRTDLHRAGVPGPPPLPAAERDAAPLPTWVEVTFAPAGDGKQTRVHLEHFGFRRGSPWDESFAFFDQVWPAVLQQLTALYKTPGKTS